MGHLRNAILGDTFQRLLRKDAFKSGYARRAELHRQHGRAGGGCGGGVDGAGGEESCAGARAAGLSAGREGWFSSILLDLYARVSKRYEEDADKIAERKKLRLDTLHALEAGGNETAEIAELVSDGGAETTSESDAAWLWTSSMTFCRARARSCTWFWETAFELMKQKGVFYKETAGKNSGCWVMKRASNDEKAGSSLRSE